MEQWNKSHWNRTWPGDLCIVLVLCKWQLFLKGNKGWEVKDEGHERKSKHQKSIQFLLSQCPYFFLVYHKKSVKLHSGTQERTQQIPAILIKLFWWSLAQKPFMTKILAKHLCDVLYRSLHSRGPGPIPAGQGVPSALHQEPSGGFSHPQSWARAALGGCGECTLPEVYFYLGRHLTAFSTSHSKASPT